MRTMEEILERANALATEMDELAERSELTEEEEARFTEIEAEVVSLTEQRTKLEARAEARAAVELLAQEPANVESGMVQRGVPIERDVYDLSEVRAFGPKRATDLRGRAMKAVEETDSWELDDQSRERIFGLLQRDKASYTAKLVLATGSKVYKEAWAKRVMGMESLLDSDERAALVRAMSLTDAAGGFAVPFPIDPTLILLGDGAANPFREISRVEQVTTDSWQGVASSAMTAAWAAEAVESGDDSTAYTQPLVPVHKAHAFVPLSIEIGMDYPEIAGDLVTLFGDAKDTLEAAAFATGSGSGQPTGIVTALTGTGNEITSITTDVFAVGDVYALRGAVGPRHRGQASWVMNDLIHSDIRQFGGAVSASFSGDLREPLADTILGKRTYEASAMDGVVNVAADNRIAVFGNFQNYLIADRAGASLEPVQHLFATANNRPSGQRGAYFWWRGGADSINDDAFGMLNVT